MTRRTHDMVSALLLASFPVLLIVPGMILEPRYSWHTNWGQVFSAIWFFAFWWLLSWWQDRCPR